MGLDLDPIVEPRGLAHPDRFVECVLVRPGTALDPGSLEQLTRCRVEPSLAGARPGSRYQFERQGYFCVDTVDSTDESLVFNRTLSLRDSWARAQRSASKG